MWIRTQAMTKWLVFLPSLLMNHKQNCRVSYWFLSMTLRWLDYFSTIYITMTTRMRVSHSGSREGQGRRRWEEGEILKGEISQGDRKIDEQSAKTRLEEDREVVDFRRETALRIAENDRVCKAWSLMETLPRVAGHLAQVWFWSHLSCVGYKSNMKFACYSVSNLPIVSFSIANVLKWLYYLFNKIG